MKLTYKNRPIEVTETEFELGEGLLVMSANFTDGAMEELTEKECLEVENEFQAELYHEAYVDMASAAYDRAKDYAKYGDD